MRPRLLALAALFATAASLQAQKRPITATDLFDFHWLADPQLSPDGHTVAFVEASVTPAHDGYQTALYTLDTAAPGATPHLLTPGIHDTTPRWSPDGRSLAFLRTADGKTQLYLTALTNSNPIRLTDLPKGASTPQWAPNGQALTVLSLTPQDQPESKREAAQKARSTGDAAHASDVRIITRAGYRFNGEGYQDPSLVPQLYLISLVAPDGTQPAPWQLTQGRFAVQESVWRADSTSILFTSSHTEEPYYEPVEHNTLYALQAPTNIPHAATPPPTQLVAELPIEAHGLALSPDSNHLAFHAEALPVPPAPPVSHQQTDLWVQDLAWRKSIPSLPVPAHNLTAHQGYELGSGVGGDNTAPRGAGRTAISWSADSSRLLDIAGSQGSAVLLSVDARSGEITRLSARLQATLAFAATPDQRSVIALISNPILIGDLFRVDPSMPPGGPHDGTLPITAGNQTQLTHANDALFSQLDLQLPEELHVAPTVRPDDIPFLSIDTFVQLPPNFDKSKKYPAILNIHGGPHSAYGWVFDHEMLLMAAKGYITIYPNPRGSTTYGQLFANIIESNYPGDDYHDLMDTVDAVVKKGWADPARLGVTGGSGGGLLTDWTVTQTTRFKAAVAQRDIVDQASWWYTADIAEFHQYWMPEAPFDHVELYRAHSPLTFVNNVKTPMMFILGDADYRTPPTSGGEEFFRALKYKHIPTVMVRFPRESHELSRSGEPWHRVERLGNILNWFDLYLDNICEPQYDVAPTPCKH